MRPTYILLNPKEKTGEYTLPLVTNEGRSLTRSSWYPKSKQTFPKGQRWGYLDEMINRTSFRVGPGAYPYKISTNRGISAVIKKDYKIRDPNLINEINAPFFKEAGIKPDKPVLRSQSAAPRAKRNATETANPSILMTTQSSLEAEKLMRKSVGNRTQRDQRENLKTKTYDLLDYLSFQELVDKEKTGSSGYMRTEPEKVVLTERLSSSPYMNSQEDQSRSVSRRARLIEKHQPKSARLEANWDLRGDFAHLKAIVLARPQVVMVNNQIRNSQQIHL